MQLELFLTLVLLFAWGARDILAQKKRFAGAVRNGAMTGAESSRKLRYQIRLLVGLALIFGVSFLGAWVRGS
jgi:hypothetical protein